MYVMVKSHLKRAVWWIHSVSSCSGKGPVQRWSCTGWTTPLQRRWAYRSAPGRWSRPVRRWGSTPGSCRDTPPEVGKWGSRHSSTGRRLPGRDDSRWSHTEEECTDCSLTEPEPGVWPTVSWGTSRCPRPTGWVTLRLNSGVSNLLAHVRPPCLFPAGSGTLLPQSKVQAYYCRPTCAVRLHTFIDLLPRSSKVSSWRHGLPAAHPPARPGEVRALTPIYPVCPVDPFG